MRQTRSSVSVTTEPSVVLGRLARLLAEGAALSDALDALVEGLQLSTAVVRSGSGALLAVGGEALHAVPPARVVVGTAPSVELPVPGANGTLTVVGARPSQLPALRAAAAVLGLALAAPIGATDLVEAAEEERDELADALHDGPVQSMLVARYAADAAARGGDPAAVREAVQQAVVDLRRTLWRLRPRGDKGLLDALDQLSAHLAEAGAAPLTVRGEVDLTGPGAGLAYRLVQAVSGSGPVRVVLRQEPGCVLVDVDGGSALPSPERWARRARVLGGDLSASAGRLRLALSRTDATSTPSGTTDARTAP